MRFVVIGGAAIQTHGIGYETQDIDVTPERGEENLARLASVLNELAPRLIADPERPELDAILPPGYFTPDVLANQMIWNLATAHGKLDVVLEPGGFPDGYRRLSDGARLLRLAGTSIEVEVASLADVERSKAAAGRQKDRRYFEQTGRSVPDSAPVGTARDRAVVRELRRAYARRMELRAALEALAPAGTSRLDDVRRELLDGHLRASAESIAGLEQRHGGRLDRAEPTSEGG